MNNTLTTYFDSLYAYFYHEKAPPASLLELKFKELIINIYTLGDNEHLTQFFDNLCLETKPSIRNIMEENFRYNLSLIEYTRLCGRSLSTFKRDFQVFYGMPPGKWLIQKRLACARQLLENQDISISDLVFECGFENTSHFTRVFKEKFNIRPQGKFHMFWNVVLGVAMPLIMAVYVGIAEKAAEIALTQARKNEKESPHLPFLAGEMNNHLTNARVMLKDMIAITNNFDFPPEDHIAHDILSGKTIVAGSARSAINTVNSAMEVVGGQSYFRKMELEKLFRDVQAAQFHPLPKKQQQKFTVDYLLEDNGQ